VNDTAFLVLSQLHFTTMIRFPLPRLSTSIQTRNAAVYYTICQQIETVFTSENKGRNFGLTVLQRYFKVKCLEPYLY